MNPCPECGQRHDPSHHTRLKDYPKPNEEHRDAAKDICEMFDANPEANHGVVADFLAARDSRIIAKAKAEAFRERDSEWYEAMRWAGIGGLMRSKVNMRVVQSRAKSAEEGV